MTNTIPKLGGINENRLTLIKNLIKQRLTENFSLKELAQDAKVNKYYLCRLFKQSTGMSIIEYRTRERVELAKCLLIKDKNTDLTFIAIHCGFYDVSHFHRYFKQMTGITPQLFRQQYFEP